MRLTRIYHAAPLAIDNIVILNEQASNHLLRVLRLKPGATIQLFNGTEGEYEAQLLMAEKNHAQVKILNFKPIDRESSLTIHLGQSISRGEKMDYTIQKAVELGVTAITPLMTEFSNVKIAQERMAKKLAHWQAVVVSACEQCGRNRVPEIFPAQTLNQWLSQRTEAIKLVLSPEGETHLREITTPKSVCLLIGAEGGLSEQEIKLATTRQFIPLKMGPRILRTETAAVAAVAILQTLWGDMG